MLLMGAPIGYWMVHIPGAQPTALYAQQVADSRNARTGLDQGISAASADQLSKVFRDVAKSLKPSVVSIKSLVDRPVVVQGRSRNLPPEIERFLGDAIPGFQGFEMPDEEESYTPAPRERMESGLGSGVIVRSDGYILTNNHVVDGASALQVVLSDDKTFEAKVIGKDVRTDLAILKIDATGLVAAPLGESSAMEVGDWVIAIGSPFGLAQTVTAGIVSATNRSDQGITLYDNFIQTDAAINPGNSGGPLLNLRGEVIGINTAIASRGGGYNGICFAVPSDTARRVLDELITNGRVTRGFIGIKPVTVNSDLAERLALPAGTRGALVETVTRNTPAEQSGIKPGDVITSYDGMPITSESAMRRAVGETKPGSQVKLSLVRDGKQMDVSVRVGQVDDEALAKSQDQPNNRSLEERVINDLGIEVSEVPQKVASEWGLRRGEGVLITKVDPRGRLARLKRGLVILSVNGIEVGSPADFEKALSTVGNRPLKFVVRPDANSEALITIR